jgi:hypothetical protein
MPYYMTVLQIYLVINWQLYGLYFGLDQPLFSSLLYTASQVSLYFSVEKLTGVMSFFYNVETLYIDQVHGKLIALNWSVAMCDVCPPILLKTVLKTLLGD